MDQIKAGSVPPEVALQVETLQQRTQRFTRRVTLVNLVLVGLLTFLGLSLSIFGSWQEWGSTALAACRGKRSNQLKCVRLNYE